MENLVTSFDRDRLVAVPSSQDGEHGLYNLANDPDPSGKRAQPIPVLAFADAFGQRQPTDAHFTCYGVEPYDPADKFFRLRKHNSTVLEQIRALGGDVVMWGAALDWDNPDHARWTAELWRAFEEKVARGRASHPLVDKILSCAAAEYTSRGGYRWVWNYTRLISCFPEGEARLRGLIALFHAAGIDVDPKCGDWTRLFRLPRVRREPDWSDEAPFYYCEIHPERELDPSLLPELEPEKTSASVRVDATMPSDDDADKLLVEYDEENKGKDTPFLKLAKKQLKGRWYEHFLFDNEDINDVVSPGRKEARHDKIVEMVASAVSCLHGKEGVTVEGIYALFREPCYQAFFDDDDRDGQVEVWRIITDRWGRQEVQAEEERKKAAVAEVAKIKQAIVTVEQGDTIVRGVRGWYPDLPADVPSAWDWIRARLIVLHGEIHFVMTPNGRYSTLGVGPRGLRAQIEHLNMGGHIPLTVEGKQGGKQHATYVDMTAGRMVVVDKVEAFPEIDGGYLTNLRDVNPKLITLSWRRRRDLVPTFHAGVDLWLQHLGGKKYETLCRQIGCFLAFERGAVAAISIIATHGAGKKLLVHGLMECLETPMLTSARALSSKFNAGIAKSPFLWANEGTILRWELIHPSDQFRSLVAGDSVDVEKKNHDSIQIQNPMRIIFTANNKKLIMQLCEGRDLAPEDRDAIAIRLQHYERGDVPSAFLKSMGGGKWTRGWIAGDSKQPSDFIVAKHFLWLYEQYGKDAHPYDDHGLLLAGDLDSPIIDSMRTRGGSTPAVIEALAGLLDSTAPGSSAGVKVEGSRLFVTVGSILTYWRANLTSGSSERLTAYKVRNALSGLLIGGRSQKYTIEGHEARWNEIDVVLLSTEIEKHGWPCARLEKIVAERLALVAGNGTNGATHAPVTAPGVGV